MQRHFCKLDKVGWRGENVKLVKKCPQENPDLQHAELLMEHFPCTHSSESTREQAFAGQSNGLDVCDSRSSFQHHAALRCRNLGKSLDLSSFFICKMG